MATINLLLIVCLLMLAVRCSETEEQKFIGNPTKHGDDSCPVRFVEFEKFLSQVEYARYEDYKCSAVRDEEAFTEMKIHILEMYEGIRKARDVTSFLLDDEYGDCLLIEEQPTVHHLGIKKMQSRPRIQRTPRKATVLLLETPHTRIRLLSLACVTGSATGYTPRKEESQWRD